MEVIDCFIILKVIELLRHVSIPQLHHICELFDVDSSLLAVPYLQRPIQGKTIRCDIRLIGIAEHDEARKPKFAPISLQFIAHSDKLRLVLDFFLGLPRSCL